MLGALLNNDGLFVEPGRSGLYANTGRAYCGGRNGRRLQSVLLHKWNVQWQRQAGWGMELDGDTGCAAAAFKEGSTGSGCPMNTPMSGPRMTSGFLTYFEYKSVFGGFTTANAFRTRVRSFAEAARGCPICTPGFCP